MKIEIYKVDIGTELTDYFSGEKFTVKNGIAFFQDGKPIKQENAMQGNVTFHPEFKKPELKTRQQVSEYLTETLKINRSSPSYLNLYAELSDGIPQSMPVYRKPIHT
jgi:hypothetical protein